MRAKIRQRLSRVGAIALKNAVYVLPRLEDCREDFEWIAQEAIGGRGEAHVCEAAFFERQTDDALVRRFREERDEDYRALTDEIRASARSAGGTTTGPRDLAALLARARKRADEIARIDYFKAAGRKDVKRLMESLERRSRAGVPTRAASKTRNADLLGRTWATRRGIKVDRIASAWFVRRFLDPKARFRFFDPKEEKGRPGEIRFDMVGGDFTHEADRCTLETLVRRTAIRDPALEPVAEIVHDIDVKDGKFGRPEARGIEQLLAGILQANPRDEMRLERGFALFDQLYESFRRKKPTARKETGQ